MKICIPGNQRAKSFETLRVILNPDVIASVTLRLTCFVNTDNEILTASYDTIFDSSEFDPVVHGFTGINSELMTLCEMLK